MNFKAKNLFSGRWLMALWICLAAVSLSTKVLAHDTGMSSLNVEFDGQILTVISDYSVSELKTISPLDDQALSALAKNSIVLMIDGHPLSATEADFTVNQDHDVIFRQMFSGVKDGRVELRSDLLSKLNPGHHQYLTVKNNSGDTSMREILTAADNSIVIDFNNLRPDTSFSKFLPLGIEHILTGYDHLLFLFALLLVVKSFGEIAKIITSFTVAHSITLSLATLNIIQISPGIIEPLIAVSIIFVGLENIFKSAPRRRWLVTYAFGLIHGFGFASALQEAGIGKGIGAAVPLLSFNLGVEIGQLAVVLIVLPVLWQLGKREKIYKNYLIPIGSCFVVSAGIYWLIERTLF